MRRLVRLVALALALGTSAVATGAAAQQTPDALILKAYEYGFPIFENARITYAFSYDEKNPERVPPNTFGHRRELADHNRRNVTTPNNDTLYSSAAVDLTAGPVRLDVPEFGDRYFSIAFIDAYTNNFAYVGTRVTGGKEGTYLIVGPDWHGDNAGIPVIRAPGNHILLIARIMIDGFDNSQTLRRLQDNVLLTLSASAPKREGLIPPLRGDPENFVAVVNQVLREDPPPRADHQILKEIAAVGIGADVGALTPAQRELWRTHFLAAQRALAEAANTAWHNVQGWAYTPGNIGDFGTDYRTRAITALQGIYANVPAEIHYAVAVQDRDGKPLDGDQNYRMHLFSNAPFTDGFWSISIYEVTPTGLFFGENPINRYAIGDRTRGIVRNTDGSLEIRIQKNAPVAPGANWLPTPAKKFVLVARAYFPKQNLLDGSFRYPGLEPVE